MLANGDRFLDVGSGTGTMLAAMACFTNVAVTGVERHAGVMRQARVMLRRFGRYQPMSDVRLITGNCWDQSVVDLSAYDVIHLYSPLGHDEIDVDSLIDRMRSGAILATSSMPHRNGHKVQPLPPVAGLPCLRKIA